MNRLHATILALFLALTTAKAQIPQSHRLVIESLLTSGIERMPFLTKGTDSNSHNDLQILIIFSSRQCQASPTSSDAAEAHAGHPAPLRRVWHSLPPGRGCRRSGRP